MRLHGYACTDAADNLRDLFPGYIARPDLFDFMQICAGISMRKLFVDIARQLVRLTGGQIASA